MARLDRETRLRYQAAIQYSVGKILEASANEVNRDAYGNPLPSMNFSREVMSAAGLLVFNKYGTCRFLSVSVPISISHLWPPIFEL